MPLARHRNVVPLGELIGGYVLRINGLKLQPPFKSVQIILAYKISRHRDRPQSSSASRRAAGASGFLYLEPVARPAARIPRAASLAHDAFAAKLAGVFEHDRAGIVVGTIEDERERLER